ncbi:hypothetical protein B0H16DRAFT_775352 [Mycena metata]|uniref:Uncharacterized protein n=1 Tax=Mycena metata TaxID=1033252 RepID=A0AAD7NBT6_9AGAR|nr:hypothetical protein B0H16DRAFT_775352 [Mycena metata]
MLPQLSLITFTYTPLTLTYTVSISTSYLGRGSVEALERACPNKAVSRKYSRVKCPSKKHRFHRRELMHPGTSIGRSRVAEINYAHSGGGPPGNSASESHVVSHCVVPRQSEYLRVDKAHRREQYKLILRRSSWELNV